MDDDIPYLLLTPGPLTTSRTVREAMLCDYCTWDADYKSLVNGIRSNLVQLAGGDDSFTAVLMQGSGTFVVEATIGSVIPPEVFPADIQQLCRCMREVMRIES